MKNKILFIYLFLFSVNFNINANSKIDIQCIPSINIKNEIYFKKLENFKKKIINLNVFDVETKITQYSIKKITNDFEEIYLKKSIRLLQFNNFNDYFNLELKNFNSLIIQTDNLKNIKIKLNNNKIITLNLLKAEVKSDFKGIYILNLNKFKNNIKNIYFNYYSLPKFISQGTTYPFLFINNNFYGSNLDIFLKNYKFKDDKNTNNCMKNFITKNKNLLPKQYFYSIHLND